MGKPYKVEESLDLDRAKNLIHRDYNNIRGLHRALLDNEELAAFSIKTYGYLYYMFSDRVQYSHSIIQLLFRYSITQMIADKNDIDIIHDMLL